MSAVLLQRWVKVCGGTDAAARSALGITKAPWSYYVNGKRKLPVYVKHSIEAHLALLKADAVGFQKMVERRRKDADMHRAERSAQPA